MASISVYLGFFGHTEIKVFEHLLNFIPHLMRTVVNLNARGIFACRLLAMCYVVFVLLIFGAIFIKE